MDFGGPTPIQKRALPIIIQGRDMMACVQTGLGNTAAYLLPIISNFLTNDVSDADHGKIASPRALIIAPRRELAVQIYLQARRFSLGSRLQNIVIYGRVGVSCQLGKLRKGSDVLVGTPKRPADFFYRGKSCQDVPEWLEEVAFSAVGTSYGPGAGQFLSRDKRVTTQGRLRNGPALQQHQSKGTYLKAKVQPSSSDVKANNASNADNDDAMWC